VVIIENDIRESIRYLNQRILRLSLNDKSIMTLSLIVQLTVSGKLEDSVRGSPNPIFECHA